MLTRGKEKTAAKRWQLCRVSPQSRVQTVSASQPLRGAGEANRNIETVAVLSCALGLRLLMLRPESSSKRRALTQETLAPPRRCHGSAATRGRVGLAGRRHAALPQWSRGCSLPGGSVFLRLTPMAAVGS